MNALVNSSLQTLEWAPVFLFVIPFVFINLRPDLWIHRLNPNLKIDWLKIYRRAWWIGRATGTIIIVVFVLIALAVKYFGKSINYRLDDSLVLMLFIAELFTWRVNKIIYSISKSDEDRKKVTDNYLGLGKPISKPVLLLCFLVGMLFLVIGFFVLSR